jgi:hypothetical protein
MVLAGISLPWVDGILATSGVCDYAKWETVGGTR